MGTNTPSSAHEETIDAPVDNFNLTQSADKPLGRRRKTRRNMALVEGSSTYLSGDTRALLQHRLSIVALLLFIGFCTFLGWTFFATARPVAAGGQLLYWIHIGLCVMTGLTALMLFRDHDSSMRKLRWLEACVFGMPALFFLVLDYTSLLRCSHAFEDGGFVNVPSIANSWMFLIFVYALFIPNNWIRALSVLTPLALAPIAIVLFLRNTQPAFVGLLQAGEFFELMVQMPLAMLLTLLSATVGVKTINTLRQEAFEARQLGQYRLKRLLGSGGMGEVYLAEHQLLKRPCAVKVIRPEKTGDPLVLARFEREVKNSARLSHWNNIDIYDYGHTEDGTFYYVMEYLPGFDVSELVAREGPLPPARVVHLMTQICAALGEAHSMGLVHRDIKPGNIFSAYRGGLFDVAKLLDFGLAKPIVSTDMDSGLTQEGSITGSPLYMSPEQASGADDVDPRSDIYALGAVMYFMLTGRPPFIDEKPLKVLIAHASEEPAPPSEHRADLPPDMEEIVMRCLQKEPDDRYQTARELQEALLSAQMEGDWDSRAAATWWECKGCPERKRMAAEAMEAAAV